MKKNTNLFIFLLIAFFSTSSMVFGIQAETENKCFACHKKVTPGLFIQWADSKHAENDVACIDCHGAEKNDPDAFLQRWSLRRIVGSVMMPSQRRSAIPIMPQQGKFWIPTMRI